MRAVMRLILKNIKVGLIRMRNVLRSVGHEKEADSDRDSCYDYRNCTGPVDETVGGSGIKGKGKPCAD